MRLFGTSGIRGVVGELLTPEFCHQIGQALGSILQRNPAFSSVPTQVFSSAPFALMIFALLLVHNEGVDRLLGLLPRRLGRNLDRAIRGRPPAALGKTFTQE